MRIIVFGATGGVGQHVISQALEKGITVTAFARTPQKITQTHPNLAIIEGNAFDSESVKKAIAGHDAVISCLGSNTALKKSTELEQMTKNIVDGMKANGVKRIIYTASAGIDQEIPGITGKMTMLMLKNVLADHRHAVEYIKSNKLIYTIARPLGLKNESMTGTYKEALQGVPGKSYTVNRADVAHFLLKALADPAYENTSVALSS